MATLPNDLRLRIGEVISALREEKLDSSAREELIRNVRGLRVEIERLVQATHDYRSERNLLRTVARNTVNEDAGSRDPDEFVRHALGTMKEMSLVERAGVVLFDAASGRPTVLHSFGLEGEKQWELFEQISSGVIALVRDGGGEVRSDEAWEDPVYREMASVREMKMRSLLCCPVPGGPGERPRGAIYIENRSRKGAFTEIYREAVRLLAAQMAQKMALLACTARFDLDRTAAVRQRGRFAEFVGYSAATARILGDIDVFLRDDLGGMPVLISGESGVGKDILARCIHQYGTRSTGPLSVVDAAALTPDSAFRALFGAASKEPGGGGNPGQLHEADGGVLVIKSISRLPREVQPALLHVLNTGKLRRAGGSEEEDVDVWVVGTCRGDLGAVKDAGDFDEALFYRLFQQAIHVPPLRERPEDIPPLARHLAASEAGEETPAPFLATDLLAELHRRSWPRNAWELRSTMCALVEACPGPMLTVSDLQAIDDSIARPDRRTAPLDWKDADVHFRRSYLAWAVQTWGPSVAEIARSLGIQRTYLYQLCAKYGVPLGTELQKREKTKAKKPAKKAAGTSKKG